MSAGPSLESRYQTLRRLHIGGMAEVFLASPRSGPRRHVIIKRMLPELRRRVEMCSRFEEEAELLALLEGPGLPTLLETGTDQQGPYLVLQYIRGFNLREILEGTGPFTPGDGAEVLEKTLRILLRLQRARDEQGAPLHFVHRDLAPENLQLDREGTLWLLDLGISKSVESRVRTDAGVRQGRLAYMAPEVLRGESATGASDLYSLAMVVAELLGAEEKISLNSESADPALIERLASAPAEERIRLPETLPQNLQAILLSLLASDPRARTPIKEVLEGVHPLAKEGALASRVQELGSRKEKEDAAPDSAVLPTPVLQRPSLELRSSSGSSNRRRLPGLGRAGNRVAAALLVAVFLGWIYLLGGKGPASTVKKQRTSRQPFDSARVRLILSPDESLQLTLDGRSRGLVRGESEVELPAGAHTLLLTDEVASRYYREDFLVRSDETYKIQIIGTDSSKTQGGTVP